MHEYMKYLGMKAKDKVTGFTGIVSTIAFDLYGCVQIVITPEAGKDGKLGESHWFDAKRLQLLSTQPIMQPQEFASLVAGAERGPAEKPARTNPSSR